MSNDQLLLQKLDIFIRKYYKNRLLRGFLFLLAISAGFYLLLVMSEFYFNFGPAVRTILFFTYMAVSAFLLGRFILIPVMQLMRVGKTISYDQAAAIIGFHFTDIRDKLLNTLQLIRQKNNEGKNEELLIAAIDQKINSLKIFRFTSAINFRKNLKYLRYAVPPLLIILILLILSPRIISEPTRRIISFNRSFIKPLPFQFELLNKNLKSMQQEDFVVQVKFTGEEIPVEAYLQTSGISFRMKKEGPSRFSYHFNMLQSDIDFRISAGPFLSDVFLIKVYPRPIILNFEIGLDFPEYIKKPRETIENSGDLVVPEGTRVSWLMFTKDVQEIQLNFAEKKISLGNPDGNRFEYMAKFMESTTYSLVPLNKFTYRSDSLQYRISVIKDGFPTIFVMETADSTLATNIFFRGTIKDDYGFTLLTFNYEMTDLADTTLKRKRSEPITIDNNVNNQSFFYTLDLTKILQQPGQSLKYYFEISDNDGLHGPKTARSEVRIIKTPTLEDIIAQTDNDAEKVRQQMENSLKETKSMKKTIDDLNRKMVDQSSMSWKEKKQLEDLIKANENVVEKVEQLKKTNTETLKREEKYLESSERIREKQRQLNDLMEQMFTDDMKKMMQEMKDLLNKVDKDKLQDLMEKMKMTSKELEKQLDQNIELYKQIEFDRKLEKTIADLKKTALEQEKLSESTKNDKMSSDELAAKQEDLEKRFDSIRNQLERLTKDGQELETPVDLQQSKSLQDSVSKKMVDSQKQLENNKKNQSARSQKEASEKMKELAQNLENMQQEAEDEQLSEDVSSVRMILENLLRLSFEQEALIADTRLINRGDPRYQELIVEQKEIKEKLKGVEDSLNSIGKRQVFIQPIISKEIATINSNIELSLEGLDLRSITTAVTRQQYTMTSINNLANLLSEALDKMNQQMQMSMKSKGGQKSCSKPTSQGGKTSIKSMHDLQQKLSKQLDQMKNGMQKPGKDGKGSKAEQSAMNMQLARMAAEQEALRNEMEKYLEGMLEDGKKDGGTMSKTISEMEENEKDIINKRISAETINRQQRILSRMLESEKAEQTREQEEQRQSTEAKFQKISNQKSNFQYKRAYVGTQEIMRLSEPALNSFYKTRVNSYLLKITH